MFGNDQDMARAYRERTEVERQKQYESDYERGRMIRNLEKENYELREKHKEYKERMEYAEERLRKYEEGKLGKFLETLKNEPEVKHTLNTP